MAEDKSLEGELAGHAKLAQNGDITQIIGADQKVDQYSDAKVRFKFTKLAERQPGDAWILLVYGPSKSGKTYFAGTAGPRTLFVNVGDGLDTLLSPAFTQRFPDAKEMIVVDIRENNPKGMAEAYDLTLEAIDHALKYFPDKFNTVVLDEATAFRKYALNKGMEFNTQARTQTIRKSRTDDYVKADVGDYGVEMDMVNWFLGTYIPIFKENKKNFLMLAHERQTFGKPAKIGDEPILKRILPGFTGKTMPDQVPQYFDDVWHSEVVGGTTYRMRTAGNDMEIAGMRHGGIFAEKESNPNYLEMLGRIRAAKPLNKGK